MKKRVRETSFSPLGGTSSDPNHVEDYDTIDTPSPGKLREIESVEQTIEPVVIRCSLPLHAESLSFMSYVDFETHYAKEHTNRCSTCGKNFPTAHFLGIHIDENHNPLREAIQARGEKTYTCFVEGCDRKCSTPQKRRLHLIDKHRFPKFYDFRVVDKGIDRATSMLRDGQKRRVSLSSGNGSGAAPGRRAKSSIQSTSNPLNAQPNGASVTKNFTDRYSGERAASQPTSVNGVEDLERSFSALQFVPTSVLMRQAGRQPKS